MWTAINEREMRMKQPETIVGDQGREISLGELVIAREKTTGCKTARGIIRMREEEQTSRGRQPGQ